MGEDDDSEVDFVLGGDSAIPTDDHSIVIQHVASSSNSLQLQHLGTVYDVTVDSPRVNSLRQYIPEKEIPDLTKFVVSPMPGQVVDLLVAPAKRSLPASPSQS